MTIAPFETLLMLINQIRDLDMVQEWINEARASSPTDQLMQLHMDRRQEELDKKLTTIKLTMLDISSRN